jgi:hypothetical protein
MHINYEMEVLCCPNESFYEFDPSKNGVGGNAATSPDRCGDDSFKKEFQSNLIPVLKATSRWTVLPKNGSVDGGNQCDQGPMLWIFKYFFAEKIGVFDSKQS